MSTNARQEHIDWAKKRALDLVAEGSLITVLHSINSDLCKHPETIKHPAIQLGTELYISGQLQTPEKVIEFIESIN